MARKKHLRPRDLPHPRSRDRAWNDGARDREFRAGRGRGLKRVPGTNGTWPAHSVSSSVPPKRPPICLFYEDVAEDLAPAPVFGQFPMGLITKILPWLRCARVELLHVCSGALPRGEGIRVDLRPEARPDVLADGRALPFATSSMAAVLIDPPYTPQYAKTLYGTEYPRPAHLLAEAARVVRPCGRIGIVHYLTPNPPPACRLVKVFGLSIGFGFPIRAVTVYEKEQDSLLGGV